MDLYLRLAIAASVIVFAFLITKRRRHNSSGWWQKSPWAPKTQAKQLQLLDRVLLTHQHSVHLLSVHGQWMAVAVGPKGCQLLATGSQADAVMAKGQAA